ncbi:Single-stranded DNA-binding protein [Streptococcus sp. DD10]|uniref:single-stranded DNA-binding protein n=1 Tax=Streptococcus sp. DD10 TaxID=1777878 RepID=UPI0007951929|nr:single-stranded DNA-binding protein [Streptococcus sp. DD10]KXT74636.1 Single-stranded DNA-binding protein [Streptococcus sp. DD10]
MINNVVLVGRMTRDAELRYTPQNQAVATFSLAVNRNFRSQNGEREADFINCVIWRQQAENLANWAKKGALIGITGRIQTRNYDNQQGQRVYVTEVVADSFQLLESRASREGQASGNSGYQQGNNFGGNATPSFGNSEPSNQVPNFSRDENPFGVTNPMEISDDDLPF